MPALTTQLDPRSQDFLDNAAFHRELVAELDRRLARAADGGGEKARAKHVERGKLLPRERIRALLDPGSPFLELSALADERVEQGEMRLAAQQERLPLVEEAHADAQEEVNGQRSALAQADQRLQVEITNRGHAQRSLQILAGRRDPTG